MERVKYWNLLRSLPSGKFYNRKVLPFQIGAFSFVLDTLFPNVSYELSLNGQTIQTRSDISGLVSFEMTLVLGINEIKWRRVGESVWHERQITASNIGTLLKGQAGALTELRRDIGAQQANASILTASRLTSWRFLYGFAETLTRSQIEEIIQGLWNWSERAKSVRQISAALNNVPVSVERIGEMSLGGQWLINNKYRQGSLGFTVEHGTMTIQDSPEFFGRVLVLSGGSAILHPTVEYGRGHAATDIWTYRVSCRWYGLGSGVVHVGSSMGTDWTWSAGISVDRTWRWIFLNSTTKPARVALRLSGTPEFAVEVGWSSLVTERSRMTLPQVSGAWEGRKAIAVWNWAI